MDRVSKQENERRRLRNLRESIPDDLPVTISPERLAELLSITVKTIYEWLARGRLGSVAKKRGKRWHILARPALELIYSDIPWT